MRSDVSLVDIHAHVLPGLDDGPRTLNDSVRMCEMYVAQGVSTVVATPHMCDPRFAVSPRDVRRGVEELSRACLQRGLDLQILPGGDVRLEPELLEAYDRGRVLTLADTGKYLLLELPLQSAPRIEGLIFELGVRGVTVVLSHPERNLGLARKPARLAELVNTGCLAQVTAGSFFGDFGAAVTRLAQGFLKAGLVHVVASDAHSPHARRPDLRRTRDLLAATVGEEAARDLLERNPRSIVRGEPLELPEHLPGRDEDNPHDADLSVPQVDPKGNTPR